MPCKPIVQRVSSFLEQCRRMLRPTTWLLPLMLGTAFGAQAQMAIPGQFSVSPTGAARYSIQIQVPPGYGGLEPTLSLQYDSQSGNSVMGVGWQLAGLSKITRCPQNLAQDGAIKGITFDTTTRFCLDGHRLVLASGSYAQHGSVYRKEIDDFSRVTFYQPGSVSTGYFVVHTKGGQVMEYGSTDNAKLLASDGSSNIREWGLNKLTDRKNNGLAVTYLAPDSVSGDSGNLHPSEIAYTRNFSSSAVAPNKVVFDYDAARTDVLAEKASPLARTTKARLTSITTSVNGTTVLQYRLGYEQSPNTGRLRLTSVTLCERLGECLPPTTVSYPSPYVMAYSSSVAAVSDLTIKVLDASTDTCLLSCGNWYTLDVNGDGKTDLVHVTSTAGQLKVWKSNGDGTFSVSADTYAEDPDTPKGQWQVLDINGDGRADLVHLPNNSGLVRVWTSNGDGTFTISSSTYSASADPQAGQWQILDVNGDGLTDMVHLTSGSGNVRVWRSKGDGSFDISTFVSTTDTNLGNGFWLAMDASGDGLTDLLHMTSNAGDYRLWRSNGDGTFTVSNLASPTDPSLTAGSWQVLDLHGDGHADLVHLTTTAGAVNVWTYSGSSTFKITSFTSTVDTNLSSGIWRTVDYNGDGLTDLVHLGSNGSQAYAWLSKGDGTFNVQPLSVGTSDTCLTCGTWLAGDVLGDGFSDLVHLRSDAGSYASWRMPRAFDIALSVSNGMGSASTWTIMALPRSGRYTMDAPSAYPDTLSTTRPPLYVVTSSSGTSGRGGWRVTNYSYGNARNDRKRGFMGFEWQEAVDSGTAMVHRTTFRQDFPFNGMVASAGEGTASGGWSSLSLAENGYACLLSLSPGVACNPGTGRSYHVYLKETKKRATDLDGTPLPGARTQVLDVDAYGNAGRVIEEVLDASGVPTGFVKTVSNQYAPADTVNWILGRVVATSVTSASPVTLPAPVAQGSGGLPLAPAPVLPAELLQPILSLLLDD